MTEFIYFQTAAYQVLSPLVAAVLIFCMALALLACIAIGLLYAMRWYFPTD